MESAVDGAKSTGYVMVLMASLLAACVLTAGQSPNAARDVGAGWYAEVSRALAVLLGELAPRVADLHAVAAGDELELLARTTPGSKTEPAFSQNDTSHALACIRQRVQPDATKQLGLRIGWPPEKAVLRGVPGFKIAVSSPRGVEFTFWFLEEGGDWENVAWHGTDLWTIVQTCHNTAR